MPHRCIVDSRIGNRQACTHTQYSTGNSLGKDGIEFFLTWRTGMPEREQVEVWQVQVVREPEEVGKVLEGVVREPEGVEMEPEGVGMELEGVGMEVEE